MLSSNIPRTGKEIVTISNDIWRRDSEGLKMQAQNIKLAILTTAEERNLTADSLNLEADDPGADFIGKFLSEFNELGSEEDSPASTPHIKKQQIPTDAEPQPPAIGLVDNTPVVKTSDTLTTNQPSGFPVLDIAAESSKTTDNWTEIVNAKSIPTTISIPAMTKSPPLSQVVSSQSAARPDKEGITDHEAPTADHARLTRISDMPEIKNKVSTIETASGYPARIEKFAPNDLNEIKSKTQATQQRSIQQVFQSPFAPLLHHENISILPAVPLVSSTQHLPHKHIGTIHKTGLIHSITAAITQQSEGRISLRIDPPELGRVTISFSHTDNGTSAHIIAEKVEISDFLRRHLDVFTKELSRNGFENNSLDFSHGDNSNGQYENIVASLIDNSDVEEANVKSAQLTKPVKINGLDIRL